MPVNPLLIAGGGLAALGVLRGAEAARKERERAAKTDETFFETPREDWVLAASAQRWALVKAKGSLGTRKGNITQDLPAMTTRDMDKAYVAWERAALKLARQELAPTGQGLYGAGIGMEWRGDAIDMLREGSSKLKLRIFSRLNRYSFGSLDVVRFDAHGDVPVTKDECEDFWVLVDRVAIEIYVDLSWEPDHWRWVKESVGEAARELPATLGRWAAATAVGAGKLAGHIAFGFIGGVLSQPVFLLGAAALGYYFVRGRLK